jgi:hypothetical protein
MADRKLSQLSALTGANTASGDLLYIVDVSEPLAADQSKKITLTEFQSAPISAGTANGLLYLNASKVPTSGAGLTYDGTDLTVVGAVNAGSVNTTTLDLTNLEVTNIKAKDGTAAATIADATGKITVSTELAVDNLNLSGNTLASTDTNGNIVLAPNGTGDVQLDADTVRIGDANSNALITTNGTGDLVLNTNSGTNSGFITIEDGVNGNIIIAPNGTGQVQITNAALDLTTIEVTNIKAKDGTAAMTLADSTGVTTFAANPILNAGTANGVPYLNGSKVLTTGSALTFDGTNFATTGDINSEGSEKYINFRSTYSIGSNVRARIRAVGAGGGSGYGGDFRVDTRATNNAWNTDAFVIDSSGQPIWTFGGSEQMRLTSTGLGIGTSSPQAKLEIAQSADNTDGPKLRIANNGNTLSNGQLIGGIDFFNGDDSGEGVGAYIYSYTTDSIARALGQDLRFATGGTTERMRLDSSGNLGIGTSSPSTKLDVVGSGDGEVRIRATSDASLIFSETTANKNWKLKPSAGDFFWLYSATAYNSGYSALMALTASGNLGIGETNPIEALEIKRDGATTASIVVNQIGAGGRKYIIGSTGSGYGSAGNLIFYDATAPAERARITSGGTFQTSLDASIYGVTVGRGAGAVATNTAVGASALAANTTGALSVAIGWNALKSNTIGDRNHSVGYASMFTNTTGNYNTVFGYGGMYANTTGSNNTAIGYNTLAQNTTGSANTALGQDALQANTTASNNTAVGYQAGYSQTTADGNALFGYQAGTSLTTGNLNSFVGAAAGGAITTGSKNTILGRYNGNQGGLDIRTADNYIVLSDGDGNPRATWFPNGWVFGYPNYTPPTDEQVVAVDNASGSMSAFLAAASPNGGQAGLRLRAGVGTTYRATRIDFYQTPASTTVPRWTLINDYNQDNSNDFRLYSGVYGNPVQTWKADGTTSVYNTLGVGNAAGSTSGAGITFPATQNASSDANTLDDYERGTFTATLKGQISDPTTPVTTTGYYTKIGNLVYVKVGFESVDTTGGSGGAYISGLPFLNVNARAFGSVGSYGGLAWNYQVTSMVSTGANYIDLMDIRSANIWTNATINVSASAYIWATVTYTVV